MQVSPWLWLLVGLLLCPVQALAGEGALAAAHLTVHGEAQLQVPADQLRLTVGVVTSAATAGAARQENGARMTAVTAALRAAGLGEKEYRTGRFQLQPQWSPRPRQAAPDWRPVIVGYTVTNTLQITTGQLELAGTLVDAATAAGANSVDNVQFDLADPQTLRAQAIAQAAASARSDAAALAQGAGVRLGRVLEVSLDEASAWPVRIQAARFAEAAVETPMAPGEVTVRAAVRMVLAIEPE